MYTIAWCRDSLKVVIVKCSRYEKFYQMGFIKIFLFFVSKTFIFDPTNSNEMNLGNILSGIPFSDKAIGMGSTKVWFVHWIFVELRHKTFKEPQRTCLNSSKAVQLGPRQSCWLCWRPVRGLHIITRTWRPDPDPHIQCGYGVPGTGEI